MPGTGDLLQRAFRRRAAAVVRDAAGSRAGDASARAVPAGAGTARRAEAMTAAEWRARRAHQDRNGPHVVIIGAGLAGLTCAYRLKQRGVHASVFEARPDRVGGRCWTARGFRYGQVAEHGGEFLDTRHVHILGLAEELGLTLEDRRAHRPPDDAVSPLWLDGGLREPEKVYAGFDDMVRALVRDAGRVGDYHHDTATAAARAFDEMTALEWLDANVSDPLLRAAVDLQQTGFFGADTGAMSAVNLLESYTRHGDDADERYHTRGGNDLIVHGMARALDPDAVRTGTPLEAVWRTGDGRYGLRFGGLAAPVLADRVVFCLPFTALREVDLTRSGLSAKRRASIDELGMGTNAKNHVQLDVRPYALGGWSGRMSMDGPFRQSSWHSTEAQDGPGAIITIWRGGRSSAAYPTGVPHERTPEPIVAANLAAFERGVPGLTAAFNGRTWLDVWARDPWGHGAYAAFLPGQYTRYWGYLGTPEGAAHFAGEHTSTYSQGYLNGAVESGERAAREVLAAR